MEYRTRSITISLTLVTMAALMVAFGASLKQRGLGSNLIFLEQQVQELSQANQSLQEKLRWVEGRYAQSRAMSKELNQALHQEKAKSNALIQRLQNQNRQVARGSSTPQERTD